MGIIFPSGPGPKRKMQLRLLSCWPEKFVDLTAAAKTGHPVLDSTEVPSPAGGARREKG